MTGLTNFVNISGKCCYLEYVKRSYNRLCIRVYRKYMENLIEPLQITEEILHKIGHDFIRRYQLKEEINTLQLKDDTIKLVEQLSLYNRTIKQLKILSTPQSIMFDQKFNEVVFKVLNCLSKIIQKLIHKFKKIDINPKLQQTVCEICGESLNLKRIKNIQRQIFDYFPLLGRQQLGQKEEFQRYHPLSLDFMNEQLIQKKMLALQRNLQDRQSGLLRSIQQFDTFRNDLIIGLPKLSSKDGFDKFNIKEHTFQMSVYFHKNLKNIENKISMMKSIVRRNQDQSVQCSIGNGLENEKNAAPIDYIKLSVARAQVQIKKLLQIKAKHEEVIKKYQIQIKSLKQHLNEVEEKNIQLTQENYLQKMKKISKQKQNKPILYNRQEKSKKSNNSFIPTENTTSNVIPADLQVYNQISSQIAEIRSQIESTGTKMQDIFPIIKSSVKKAIDHIMNQRMSSTLPLQRRKLYLDTQQDSMISSSKKKLHGSSFKGVSNFYNKKDKPFKEQDSSKYQQPGQLYISSQFNYKIFNTYKPTLKKISILDQKLLQGIDTKPKKSGLSLYKKSLLQTEGSPNLRKIPTKMSSQSSQFKQNLSIYQENVTFKNQRLPDFSSFYRENTPNGFCIGQNCINDLFSSKKSQFNLVRKYKKNISCEDLVSLVKKQDGLSVQKDKPLISIRKISAKKIPQELVSSFFYPKINEQKKCETQIQRLKRNHHKTQQIRQNFKKQLKRQMTKIINIQKGNKLKSIIVLKLDEISYLTIFFALLAQAHLSNPSLYAQLKQQIFAPSKDQSSLVQNDQTMLRELVSQIILLHRKCEQSKDNKLCKHLSQFIQAFQSCLNVQ